MTTKEIKSFSTSASLTHDTARIELVFVDDTKQIVDKLPPARFAAVMAALQASSPAWLLYDPVTKQYAVGSSADTPGAN